MIVVLLCIDVDKGLVMACTAGSEVEYTWWVVETATVKETVSTVEFKINVSGLTATYMPAGGSVCLDIVHRTKIRHTCSVSVIDLLRFGIIMDYKFTSE
ncbi:hypothetical protein ACLB2K_046611 [Fragaria x ananassa]